MLIDAAFPSLLPVAAAPTVGAAAAAHVSVSLSLLLIIAAGAFAVLDSGLRFRRPGGGAVLAILELELGLLLVISRFTLVQPYVSTTIPVLALAIALAVVLIIQLVTKAARKNGTLWLTVLTLGLAVAAAAVVYLRIR